MACGVKIRKITDLCDQIEEVTRRGLLSNIERSARDLCIDRKYAMALLKIKNCNGAEGFGISFAHAWCGTQRYLEKFFPFASVFLNGLDLLNGILKSPDYNPPDEVSKEILKKLLSYICDHDCISFVLNLNKKRQRELNNEVRLAVALAEHLFKKLALNSDYTLDNGSKYSACENECKCGCKKAIREKFGNTTIGHGSVWHGSIDILVGKMEVPVIISEGEKEKSPGGRVPVEVKYKPDNIEGVSQKHRMIAQAIVFSFLQKQRHPSSKQFLIPCIGVSSKFVIFYFYDSKNDCLLQTSAIPLFDSDMGSVNFKAIIAIWLVLNYKYLGSGPSKDILEAPKSGFFAHAHDVIDIYNDFLSVGDVTCESPMAFDPSSYENVEFTWPEEHSSYVFLTEQK